MAGMAGRFWTLLKMTTKKSKIVMLPLTTAAIDPLLRDIFQALAGRGGSAHRDLIVRSLIDGRVGAWAQGLDCARDQIIQTFENYLAFAETMAEPHPYAYLPFGPDSRRWALTETGRQAFFPSAKMSAA